MLLWVSADAEDKSAAPSDLDTRSGAPTKDEDWNAANGPKAGHVYKVRALFEQSHFMVDGIPRSIQSGMTGGYRDGSAAGD